MSWAAEITVADTDQLAGTADSLMDKVIGEIMAMPPRGKPAADLTERERLAVAIALGVSTQTFVEGHTLIVRTAVPVAISDRGDGGYIVAVGANP